MLPGKSEPSSSNLAASENKQDRGRNIGFLIAGALGVLSLAITGITTPFVLPALRKYCLPYVPATDSQLDNILRSLRKHALVGGRFVDIGSGDGRVCRASAKSGLFAQVHGVELNYPLVLYSRLSSLNLPCKTPIKYHHKDLWNFSLADYDTLCIFGVESMMGALEERLLALERDRSRVICACRFPFTHLKQIDELGEGIDTVWVYRIDRAQDSSKPADCV